MTFLAMRIMAGLPQPRYPTISRGGVLSISLPITDWLKLQIIIDEAASDASDNAAGTKIGDFYKAWDESGTC